MENPFRLRSRTSTSKDADTKKCVNIKEADTANMCLSPLLFVRKPPLFMQKKRPKSVSGQRSLIEYGLNAKAEFSKEMDVCASQRTHPKPKQLRKTLFSKKSLTYLKRKSL